MPPDQQSPSVGPTPADLGSVIEFGAPDEAPRPRPGRRFSVTAWAAGLAADRRLVPLAAALGAVALFASLISEWQITDIDATLLRDADVGTRPLPATIADLGGWGGGYLAGVFLLVAAAVLVLFGPAPGRRYARLAGLSTGGMLIALLAAIGSDLGDSSRLLARTFSASAGADQVQVSYGRGLWCALFGVAFVTLALVLAGRHLPEPATDDGATRQLPADPEPPVWSWRRPTEADTERPPDEPFDLTVSSVKPFTAATDDRDEPR